MFPMVFNLHGVDRIAEWKNFREQLETSLTPFEDVANLWSQAPFVNPYLDPHRPDSWPDPWRLLIDLKLDDLAISLGILYTLKLTQRFMGTPIEIHMSMLPGEKEYRYPVIVDNHHVLNWEYNTVSDLSSIQNAETTLIFSRSGSL